VAFRITRCSNGALVNSPLGSGGAKRWEEVRAILTQALALPADSRSTFLDGNCGDDAALWRELEELLAAASQSAFLDRPAAEHLDLTFTQEARPVTGLLRPGDCISHCRIETKIGEGGMGVVYRAIDTNLNRTVALKMISRNFITGANRARFAREAKAASALNHPNIVTIYEYNSVDDADFIAMEYTEGTLLDRALSARVSGAQPVPLATLLGYAGQAAAALAKAHQAGIVHRDLKPANLIVSADGQVKVLDFGLPKRMAVAASAGGESLATQTALTRVGAVVGTPSYLSPEQATGEHVDARSDIFSFGIILYEIAAKVRPFHGPNAMSTMAQIVQSDPRPVCELNPDVPGALAELISQCLEKNVERRLQSLNAMQERLERIAASPGAPAARPVRYRMAAAAVLLLTAATAVTPIRNALVESVWRRQEPTAGPVGTPQELTQQARALLARYDKAGNMDSAIALAERALGRDPNFAPAYAVLAEAHWRKGAGRSDKHWINLAEESACRAVAANPDLAAAHEILGAVLVETGQAHEARQYLDRALELDPLSVNALIPMAKLSAKTDPAAALRLLEKAVSQAPDNWIPRLELGIFHDRASRNAEAVAEWNEAMRLAPGNVRLLRNLAAAHHMMGNYDKSISTLQEILNLDPSAGG